MTLAQLVAAYPSGWVGWHRCGANVGPENTVDAIRIALAAGAVDVNIDCELLSDGTVGVMHDTTVDRTTTSTGNVTVHTAMSWSQLVNDPATYLAPGWVNTTCPLLTTVLDLFGTKVHLTIESMSSGTVQAVVNAVVARKLQDTVTIMSRTLGDLAPAVSAGISTALIDDTGATSAATILAAGVTRVAVKTNGTPGAGVSQATIDAYKAAGLTVQMYTLARQTDASGLYTGVEAWHADDPHYLAGILTGDYRHRRTTDTFALNLFSHGLIPSPLNVTSLPSGAYADGTGRNRGTLTGGKLRIPGVSNAVLLGGLSPVANAAGSYTISGTSTFTTIDTDSTSYQYFVVCATDDYPYHISVNSVKNTGYLFVVRQNGSIDKWRVGPNISAAVSMGASTSTTAITVNGTAFNWSIAVTPTTVTFTRADTGATCVITDSQMRGGYLHYGVNQKNGVGVFDLSALAIT